MRGLRRGKPTAISIVLAAAGCTTTTQHEVGTPPERTTSQTSAHQSRTSAERAEAIRRHKATGGGEQVEEAKPDEPRLGVATTRVFHRLDCKLLAGVPTSDQLRFTSAYEAVDARYSPCPECKPFE